MDVDGEQRVRMPSACVVLPTVIVGLQFFKWIPAEEPFLGMNMGVRTHQLSQGHVLLTHIEGQKQACMVGG